MSTGGRKLAAIAKKKSNQNSKGKMDLSSSTMKSPFKRKRRKPFLSFPLSVALSAFAIFLFFVVLGRSRGRMAEAAAVNLGPLKKRINLGQPTLFTYEVMAEYPHDPEAFTQGLEYDKLCDKDGKCRQIFWESTGMNGRSSVREVEVATGKVLRSKLLPHRDFGEGLTKLRDRLYQITWRSNRAWSYAAADFSDAKLLKSPLADGWGATSNGTHLILGDSSDTLFFVDPVTMQTVRQIQVTDGETPVKWLNELEWVDGVIYANVFTTECVAQIDPHQGNVVGWLHLQGLKDKMMAEIPGDQLRGAGEAPDVLNGIAWDGENSRLFVTGKQWPKLYQVELRPMYIDSKATDVVGMTQKIRDACIIPPGRNFGR